MEETRRVFYGTLATVSADNLGSLALGGFKESCSSLRCCRHCMATQDTARSKVRVYLEGYTTKVKYFFIIIVY